MKLYVTSFSETEMHAAKALDCGLELAFTTAQALDGFNDETRAQASALFSGAAGRSVHGAAFDTNYSTSDPLIRDVVRLRFGQSASVARALGSPVVILHSSGNRYECKNASAMERWLDRCAAFWEEFLPTIPAGVQVALENLGDCSPKMFARQLDIVERFGAGCCLDVGHAACNSDVPVAEWIDLIGPRVTHVHMHDNDFMFDRHWPLGDGKLPIADMFERLNRYVAPDTPCVLECDFSKSVAWLRQNGIRV